MSAAKKIVRERPTITEASTTGALTPIKKSDKGPVAVDINSLAATAVGLGFDSVVREMRKGWARRVLFLIENEHLEPAEAVMIAGQGDVPTDEVIEELKQRNVESISWGNLSTIYARDPDAAEELWAEMQEQARQELDSGHRAAEVFESTDWQREPWKRAQYLAIRDGFIEEWQPRGTLERTMIDILAESFVMFQHWTRVHYYRATSEAKALPTEKERKFAEKHKGEWWPPRVYEQEATEQAAAMADRFNRVFLRTLRNLRDLRRYTAPVTINNPEQVNIAADGGQQVNMQERKGKRVAGGKGRKRKGGKRQG